jgi:hypothetical protein
MKYKSTAAVLLIAIVCASVALSSFAQTGEVYSLNVVGFQKLTAASNGLTMVSTPFLRTSNTLDDIVGGQLAAGKSSTLADNVLIWNKTNQSYDTYWLRTDRVWFALSGSLATNTSLPTDAGFWIRNRRTTNQTVVVSGDVVDYNAITNVLVPGLTMVSYPFSTDIDINRSSLTNGKNGKSSTLGDNITIWDAAVQGYQTYWLRTDKVWRTLSGEMATNVFVGSGKGFWYRNRNAANFNWVESRPYTL